MKIARIEMLKVLKNNNPDLNPQNITIDFEELFVNDIVKNS